MENAAAIQAAEAQTEDQAGTEVAVGGESFSPPSLAGDMDMSSLASAPAMAIWFNEPLFDKARLMAKYLAAAKGMTPPHLLGQPEACFAVVERSLTWKLSPFAVAQSTYATPGGKVGFEGKLVQAILENSGKLVGPVRFEHYVMVQVLMTGGKVKEEFRSNSPELAKALEDGAEIVSRANWSQVQGRFEVKKSDKGKDYARATWGQKDAVGLGVTVRAQVKGEAEPREIHFDLIQAFPRNSTLWALDPKTQICYTAVRRFASVAAPGLFMGVPFDNEDPAEAARDVTPQQPAARPTRADFQQDDGPLLDAVGDPIEPGMDLREHYLRKDAAKRAAARQEREIRNADRSAAGKPPIDEDEDEPAEEPEPDESERDTAETEKSASDDVEKINTPPNPAEAKAKEIMAGIQIAPSRHDLMKFMTAQASHIAAMPKTISDQIKKAADKKQRELEGGA